MDDSATVAEAPPPFQDTHVIELISGVASKITGMSVYTSRAEVTRLFKLELGTGKNRIIIDGLPTVLDADSVRADGYGSVQIHNVTVLWTPLKPFTFLTSPLLEELEMKKTNIEDAKERVKNASEFLIKYLGRQDSLQTNPGKLQDIIDKYKSASHKLDERLTDLRAEKRAVCKQIRMEEERLRLDHADTATCVMLDCRVTISVFADVEGPVELELRYAATNATWKPIYNVGIETEAGRMKGKPGVALTYKASIAQYTGEDWIGVPIVLRTAKPTAGLCLPSLCNWILSVYDPPPPSQYPDPPHPVTLAMAPTMMSQPMMAPPIVVRASVGRTLSAIKLCD
ncbi:hypothetical protein FA15DRAFT_655968 [Coprinopsis marcescibilis]|uniref:DUF4140 domain-containing protein n=1 Tax=Coprinopsis marcescibilis TaxID=230819 RepID=A0A5C3KV71_COPMA|nr:hypothetical protein FA15DRAFT_655968 [Coprinopsis marcescibilis]